MSQVSEAANDNNENRPLSVTTEHYQSKVSIQLGVLTNENILLQATNEVYVERVLELENEVKELKKVTERVAELESLIEESNRGDTNE